jgi:hypothetical protein
MALPELLLRESGNTPVSIDKFINDVNWLDVIGLHCLITVADKIGEDIVYDPTTHPSILEIKNHVDVEKNFEFQHITSDKIEKNIDKINIKKASGFDNIPAKVIKQCKPIISNQLTSLINL